MSGSRPRRSTGEVRRQILDAARDLFLEQGFDRTTTREIAKKAGVAEPLLFRHFSSKTGLLEQVLVTPLTEYVETFLQKWETDRAATTIEQRTREYIRSVYELMRSNRELIIHLLRVTSHPDIRNGGPTTSVAQVLDGLFVRLAGMVRADLKAPDVITRPDMGVRFTFALVTSIALLDQWLFAVPESPTPDLLIEELTTYVLATLDPPTRSRSA